MFVYPGLRSLAVISAISLLNLILETGDLPSAEPAPAEKTRMIAGTSEVLKTVPKRFASLIGVDAAHQRVTLLVEGENLPKVWPLSPDAEVRVAGWWGRLEQLQAGDRVWVWFAIDRSKQPVSVLLLADELSQQEIQGDGLTVEAAADFTLTVKNASGESRTLKVPQSKADRAAAGNDVKAGDRVHVQSAGGHARLLLSPASFEARRLEQKAALRKRWLDEGLPGTVVFLHIGGEMEFMLDHEAMQWGRSLRPGDRVTLRIAMPIEAEVKQVRPWRERTQVRLVVGGSDQADLLVGQRVHLHVAAPSAEVEKSEMPPDLDRPRSRDERIEWMLASIYCPCKVKGDTCTGQFYTLSSCNPNTCGMPNAMRAYVAKRIDKGMTDKQILEELLKEHGSVLLRPHLLP